MNLSIIIPAYNEEKRLPSTLESVCTYLQKRGGENEVIIVSDGSSDETVGVVREAQARYPFLQLMSYKRNRGKGFAVRYGVTSSKGDLVLINDADGSTPISEVERLEREVTKEISVVVGSRALGSPETNVRTVWYRKIIGRTFAAIVNFLIVPGIADTQCGFKLFTRAAADELFWRQRAEHFSFDVELLFLARRLGFGITEVAINWTNTPGSKVNLVSDSMEMLVDILRFRWMAMTGVYANKLPPELIQPRE